MMRRSHADKIVPRPHRVVVQLDLFLEPVALNRRGKSLQVEEHRFEGDDIVSEGRRQQAEVPDVCTNVDDDMPPTLVLRNAVQDSHQGVVNIYIPNTVLVQGRACY